MNGNRRSSSRGQGPPRNPTPAPVPQRDIEGFQPENQSRAAKRFQRFTSTSIRKNASWDRPFF